MLDFIGTVVAATLMVFIVNAVLIFMDASRTAKLVVAAVAGLWIGFSAAASAAGWIAIARPFPVIGLFVAAPLAAAWIAWAWPQARAAMLSIPMPVMISLNVGRVFGFMFLLLAAEGRLAGPFPYSAAWGDIITGVVALPMMWLATAKPRSAAIAAWNLFGTADLVAAITLGVISADGSSLQVIHAPPGSAAMQELPWSFIPTVLVPFWLILHALIAVKLRRAAKI